MRVILCLSLIFSALTMVGQALQHHVVNVGDFTHLRVVNAVNVDYKSHPDSAGMAVFDAPADLVNSIMFINNNKGKLSIEVDVVGAQSHKLPTVTVYSRFLTNIENVADSTVRAFDVNAGPKFKARLEGNGRLSLRGVNADEVAAKIFTGRGQLAIDGSCVKANLSCAGPCAIQADQLFAKKVTATVNGPCTIGCNASEELTVKGVGPGTVYYVGAPLVKNRSIGAKVKELK